MDIIFETMQGLEDVAAEEVDALVGVLPHAVASGRLVAAVPSAAPLLEPLGAGVRCSDRFGVLLADTGAATLADAKEVAAGIRVERFLSSEQSFGVRYTRRGEHDFNRQDLGAAVGAGILQRFRERGGPVPAVDLDTADVIVRAELFDTQLLLWVDAVGDRDLSYRPYREYAHMASMRPMAANLLLRLAGWRRDTDLSGWQLIDPFCGSATILIEAMSIAATAERSPDAGHLAHGVERFPGHVHGAVGNIGRAGMTNHVVVHSGLAEETHELLPARVDGDERDRLVVTNPPFGRRVASPRQVDAIYRGAAESWARADVRRVVTLAERAASMTESLTAAGFEITRASEAIYGATPITVFVAER